MKIYHEHTTGAQVHFRYYDFDRFENEDDFIFIDAPQIFTEIPNELWNNKIIYLEQEEPNRFFSDVGWFNDFEFDNRFDRVLSICPYTTDWYHKVDKANHINVFMPIKFQPQQEIKLYDICFAGHIYSGHIENDLLAIKDFNYRIVSNTDHPMTTNKSVSQDQKLQIIAQSKISLVHNLLYPTDEHIKNVKKIDRWQENSAFSRLDEGIVPQIKGRVFEAAMCKSLILCQRDPWNVIERFFEPEKEFIYYEKGRGKEKITKILANYEKYLPVIEAAYQRNLNYTTEKFYHQYLENIV